VEAKEGVFFDIAAVAKTAMSAALATPAATKAMTHRWRRGGDGGTPSSMCASKSESSVRRVVDVMEADMPSKIMRKPNNQWT